MNRACNGNFFLPCPLGPCGGVKYHLISITKSTSKIFIPNFVCVLTNERYKTYQTEFYSVAWVMPQGWDLGALGCPGGQKDFFFKYGHVTYQIDGDDEQNRMQVNFSSYGQTGDLGVRSNIIKFRLPCQFTRFFYQTLCVFSQIKDRKHIVCCWVHAPGVGLGGAQGGWVKNLS